FSSLPSKILLDCLESSYLILTGFHDLFFGNISSRARFFFVPVRFHLVACLCGSFLLFTRPVPGGWPGGGLCPAGDRLAFARRHDGRRHGLSGGAHRCDGARKRLDPSRGPPRVWAPPRD